MCICSLLTLIRLHKAFPVDDQTSFGSIEHTVTQSFRIYFRLRDQPRRISKSLKLTSSLLTGTAEGQIVRTPVPVLPSSPTSFNHHQPSSSNFVVFGHNYSKPLKFGLKKQQNHSNAYCGTVGYCASEKNYFSPFVKRNLERLGVTLKVEVAGAFARMQSFCERERKRELINHN